MKLIEAIKESANLIGTPKFKYAASIFGMIGSVVMFAKETYEKSEVIRDISNERKETGDAKRAVVRTMKEVVPGYIPSLIMLGVSVKTNIDCYHGLDVYNIALAAALNDANGRNARLVQTMNNEIGEEKTKEIVEKSNEPGDNKTLYSCTEPVLMYESSGGQEFYSDVETVRRIVNDINYKIAYCGYEYVDFSEFYDELDIPHTIFSDSHEFNIANGLVDISFTPDVRKGKPCLRIDFLSKVSECSRYHSVWGDSR